MPSLRWQPIATFLLSLAGLGVATYLTITHFDTHVALVCSDNGAINCEKVTTSPQSVIFGIPVAVLGLAFFLPMLALCLPVSWRSADRRVHLARLALSITGVGMIIYLIIAELFVIKAICLWCSSVHLITFILFVIIVTASPIVLAPGYGLDGGELDHAGHGYDAGSEDEE
ncbi:MAG: vitamin K epoxide reductase family protein [Acidimicrobiales bacterium]